MTDAMLCQIIQKQIERAFSENQDVVSDALADGLGNDTTPIEGVIAKIACNSVRLSVLMAVQMTLRILETTDIIKLSDDLRPQFEIILGGKEGDDE